MKTTKNMTELFNKNNIDKSLIPIDLIFMKERAKSRFNKNQVNNDKPNNINMIKPNYINKIGYSGYVHFLPYNPISQIINLENIH